MCPYTPCAMHTLTSVHMLKVHSISEFSGNTKTPSLHHRLDSITLVTAGFPQRKQPEFPMGEITMEQYSCTPPKKKKKKRKERNCHLEMLGLFSVYYLLTYMKNVCLCNDHLCPFVAKTLTLQFSQTLQI